MCTLYALPKHTDAEFLYSEIPSDDEPLIYPEPLLDTDSVYLKQFTIRKCLGDYCHILRKRVHRKFVSIIYYSVGAIH